MAASAVRAQQLLGALVVTLLLVPSVFCDVYMHNPRGSNNRLNERTANRANGNRLFDSQNNNKGGYNVGDEGQGSDGNGQIRYYEGSEFPIEWTAQHGCGNGKLSCQMVIQYMCDCPDCGNKPLRDGTSTATPSTDNDNTATGLHEDQGYYAKCVTRDRNKGLFTADQNLRGNSAKYTRQNPNGNRRGLECPEERDYYPYWHPSPWVDVAVLTEDTDRCPFYREESENVKGKGFCGTNIKYNNEAACQEASTRQDVGWLTSKPHKHYRPSLKTVDCQKSEFTRDNHLGNRISDAQAPTYQWTVPSVAEACESDGTTKCRCVMRLRYNISTLDYSWETNSTFNGNQNIRDGFPSPVQDNPDVNPGTDTGLRLAMNTNQYGRTFQDRSHIFEILPRPAAVPANARIHNINVRGKRGNIVQCYPAVEYDFTPNNLTIKAGDWVQFQWTGSNTHDNNPPAGDGQAGDDGEGTGGTDRSNVVQIDDRNDNYPTLFSNLTMWPTDSDIAQRVVPADDWTHMKLVFSHAAAGKSSAPDPLLNNASPTYRGPLMKMTEKGMFHYMCTRNNNFSNRSQKGTIIVE